MNRSFNLISKSKTDSIRIIGGKWRSRKIAVLNQEGLRPTTDRLRETLFNWLAPYVDETLVGLDLFAGSGALGFEFLSRGAAQIVFVEKEAAAISLLKQTALHLQTDRAQIIHQSAFDYLKSAPQIKFDFIFIDPPFFKHFIPETLLLIEQHLQLNSNAFIYIESELNLTFTVPTNWRLHREKKTKQLKAQLFKLI